jgi:hypothetical protein
VGCEAVWTISMSKVTTGIACATLSYTTNEHLAKERGKGSFNIWHKHWEYASKGTYGFNGVLHMYRWVTERPYPCRL